MKNKLIELLKDSPSLDAIDDAGYVMGADHLIANGVTIREQAVWIPYHDYFTKKTDWVDMFQLLCGCEGRRNGRHGFLSVVRCGYGCGAR